MRPAYLNILIFIISLYLGCSDYDPTSHTYPEPYIKISNPLMNSSVPDSTTIKIESNINDLIRVELYIDQFIPSKQAVFQDPPYEYLWNTTYYEDGSQHILKAKGYYPDGNLVDSKYVIVNVFRFRPSNLQAVLKSAASIELNWTDNCTYETGFEIEEAVNDSIFTQIGVVDSNVTSYSITDSFNIDDIYYFRVRAKSEDDFSGYSNIAAAAVALNAPENLDVDFISDSAATLNWKDNNDFETGYRIEKYVPHYGYFLVKDLPANTTETVVTDSFKAGYYYDYIIYPVLDMIPGPSAHFPYRDFPFPSPYDLKVQGNSMNSLTLTWNDNNDYELGFIIQRSSDGISYQEIGRTSDHSYTDINLDTSYNYKYRTAAYSRYNTSGFSNSVPAFYATQLNQVNKFRVHYGISWTTLSYDASVIAFGGYTANDVAIYVYSTFTGTLLNTLFNVDSTSRVLEPLTISPDNKLLAARADNGYITVWDISSGSVIKRINNISPPGQMRFSYDGKYLIIERSGKLLFYDVQTWQSEVRITNPYYISRMDISPNQTLIATRDRYDNIKLWDYNRGNLIYEIPGTVNAYALKFNRKGNRLYAPIDNVLYAWVVNSGWVVLTIPNFWSLLYFDINESQDMAVSSYTYPGMGVWQLSSGNLIQEISSDPGIAELFFTPDNNYLIGREFYQYYYIWKIVKGWTTFLNKN